MTWLPLRLSWAWIRVTRRLRPPINAYYASDIMIEKVREIIKELEDIGDTVKSEDIISRLKTLKEDALRQLKDRSELFVAGQDIIKFGAHKFTVNTQPLDLTVVNKQDALFFHLSGMDFFERIEGDNVMIYLDDIQHCNPEFLQKFISLCDAQRKIEGVYKGKSRTYDFRGKGYVW